MVVDAESGADEIAEAFVTGAADLLRTDGWLPDDD